LGQTTSQDFDFKLDTVPPVVAVSIPAENTITRSNVTVTGAVSDASGIASLVALTDFGAGTPVSIDAQGHFSFPTSFALGGADDGSHTIELQATDKAGNVSVSDVNFTLDSAGPTIAFSGAASGLAVNQNLTLSGQVADALSGVASLSDAVDSGAFHNVTVG